MVNKLLFVPVNCILFINSSFKLNVVNSMIVSTWSLLSRERGMVTHFELLSCVVIAFSRSSRPLHFRSFFTRDFTAFSDHFSSCSVLNSPFFQPSSRFSMGDVKGILACVVWRKSLMMPSLPVCILNMCAIHRVHCRFCSL